MRSVQFWLEMLTIGACLVLFELKLTNDGDLGSSLMQFGVLPPVIGMAIGAFMARNRPMVTAVNFSLIMGAALFAGIAAFGGEWTDSYVMGGIWITHWFLGLCTLVIGFLAYFFPSEPSTRGAPPPMNPS